MKVKFTDNRLLNKDLVDLFRRGSYLEFEFNSRPFSTHSDLDEKRVVYIPIKFGNSPIPEDFEIGYVRVVTKEETFYLVHNALYEYNLPLDTDSLVPSINAKTEVEAKQIVLFQIQEYIDKCLLE